MADGVDTEPGWFRSRLPAPLTLASQPWWLVCSVERGAALWYADEDRPGAVMAGFFRKAGGPWLPLDGPGEAPWLQLRAGVLDGAALAD